MLSSHGCGWMECFSSGQEQQKWALCDSNLAVRSSVVSSSIGFEPRNWVMGLSAPQWRFTVEAALGDERVCVLQNQILECRLEKLTRLRDLSFPHTAAVHLYRGSSNHVLRHLFRFPHLLSSPCDARLPGDSMTLELQEFIFSLWFCTTDTVAIQLTSINLLCSFCWLKGEWVLGNGEIWVLLPFMDRTV